MLSESGVANLLTRPRPPGSRRSSSTKIGKGRKDLAAEEDEKVRGKDEQDENHAPRRANMLLSEAPLSNKPGHHVVMERDLELDLPMDLFSTVGGKTQIWPHSRHLSADDGTRDNEVSATNLGANLDRSLTNKVKKRHSMQEQVSPERSPTGREALQVLYHSGHPGTDDEEEAGQVAESDVESERSLDSEWVGELPREELESLLMQANRVIKERERDLGIAAAIGKALLEKNISLRSKHEGIMTRLSSINSFSQLNADEDGEEEQEEVSSNGLPRYTPPTTDSMLADSEGEEDSTPMPTPRANDYFENNSIPEFAPKSGNGEGGLPTYSSWPAAGENEEGHGLFDRQDYFVPSIPPSPARSQGSEAYNRSQYYTAETQRQLEILSEQNEELLEQLAQLQNEAEDAKRSGGKRLKKLNREIEGLRAELEASTERNTELEKEVADDAQDTSNDGDSRDSRKMWRRRRAGQYSHSSDEGELTLQGEDAARQETHPASEELTGHSGQAGESPESGNIALPCRSESSASIATETRTMSAPERALIAQLMAKIRELEETNASLTLAGTEMDGRIGKAMVEGERIRDAYEAVEQHAALDETQMMRDESVMSESQYVGSPCSSTTASPAAHFKKRRAPGNRYIIEGRKTLRGVMKSEQSLRRVQKEYYYNSGNDSSSTSSSPVKGRSIRRSLRPRILITPSTEDLRGSSEADSLRLDSWQRTPESPSRQTEMSTPLGVRPYGSRFDMADGLHEISPTQLASSTPSKAVRTLGSELGSVQGYEDDYRGSPVQYVVRRLGRDGGPLRLADLQRSTSGASIHLRSRASITSLRAPSEAESDIADLRWSTRSDETVTDAVGKIEAAPDQTVLEDGGSADETVQQLALTRAVDRDTSLAILEADSDGTWCAGNDYDVLPRGSLKNDMQSTHDSYEFIEKVTSKLPLQWADDDDFGRPITESDARRLGLFDGARLRSSAKEQQGLLAWVQKKTSINRKKPEKGKARQKTALQVESREDIEASTELAELLRAKRIIALRSRVASGHISLEQARMKGVLEDFSEPFIEEEITTRAFAYSTARQRQIRAHQLKGSEAGRGSGAIVIGSTADKEEDSDLYKRRDRRRGSEANLLQPQDRYQPKIVKQRAKQFSTEAITWASAWATFSLVMVFAFLVAFSRGPKRVLNGNAQKR